ncbi:hypothetical protein SADUNF_Sadunf01G0129100 [Salix dunnii]|uniref:Uncharacterized protein n=1 Tax=Salix dunnii TaxID=1413687 RepID=A0A835TNE3_9ROSI|nr:hypothetical protein SADUNF_Sadunf01G0129100 [Salix dunnii]
MNDFSHLYLRIDTDNLTSNGSRHRLIDRSGDDEGKAEQWVEVISWEPRALIYHNFLWNLYQPCYTTSIINPLDYHNVQSAKAPPFPT